jgi:hypothetical protein
MGKIAVCLFPSGIKVDRDPVEREMLIKQRRKRGHCRINMCLSKRKQKALARNTGSPFTGLGEGTDPGRRANMWWELMEILFFF